MTDLTRRALRRLTMLALLAAVFLLAGWATPARADLDRIRSYTVTVDPRTDGSADITYDIDWEVIGGSPDEPLSWVRIGLANSAVDELENLSPDTVSQVRYTAEGGGSFAQVVFKNRYYPPDHAARTGSESRVQFAFRVHQSQLYTLNSDGTADYVFTPGWFSDLSIDQLTIRWKQLEGAAADTDTLEGGYYVWTFGPLDHDERATVRVRVPAALAAAFTADTVMPADRSGRSAALAVLAGLLPVFITLLVVGLILLLRRPRWQGASAPPPRTGSFTQTAPAPSTWPGGSPRRPASMKPPRRPPSGPAAAGSGAGAPAAAGLPPASGTTAAAPAPVPA